MKMTTTICLLVVLLPAALAAQVTLVEHVVDSDAHGAASVYASDVDGDGDKDLLAAMYEEDRILWWRNDGGNPIAWTRFVIGDNFLQAGSVYAADLDNDSLTDVLGVARVGDEVAWWHNEGGDPITWTKYTIRAGYDFAHEVCAADMDKDGDMDVLGASTFLNQITWWRNDGGSPIAWTEQVIGSNFSGAKSVHVADFDGDDTLDVVGAAILSNDVTWWRNDGGNPVQWTQFLIDGNFGGAHRVQAVDLNLDGRPDVVGAAYFSNEIAWWRNNGGDTITWTKQTIGTGFGAACVAQAIDLDGDEDLDVVATAQSGNQVAWWRNDNNGGEPFTWTRFLIDSLVRVWPLFACDLDGDRDNDVIAASGWAGTNELKWWENQGNGITEARTPAGQTLRHRATVVRSLRGLSREAYYQVFDASGRVTAGAPTRAGIYFARAAGATEPVRLVLID